MKVCIEEEHLNTLKQERALTKERTNNEPYLVFNHWRNHWLACGSDCRKRYTWRHHWEYRCRHCRIVDWQCVFRRLGLENFQFLHLSRTHRLRCFSLCRQSHYERIPKGNGLNSSPICKMIIQSVMDNHFVLVDEFLLTGLSNTGLRDMKRENLSRKWMIFT